MTNGILERLTAKLEKVAVIGSPSDSFTVTLDILGESSLKKILGELVCFISEENSHVIVSIGQINEVTTSNKWHEEPSFKAVIKRHGSLPHLSGDADNRIASLTIQSSFKFESTENIAPHKLSNSPSTGTIVYAMNNEVMSLLIEPLTQNSTTEVLGKAYDTDVNIPFWFKHFGDGDSGAGDAYHTGVFGKTGSGKTTTAARIISGYSNNSAEMSFLVLDPQEQFYNDNKVIPDGSFREEVESKGIAYRPVLIPQDIALPNDAELFSELLMTSGFINKLFGIKTAEKRELMSESIEEYLVGRMNKPSFNLGTCNDKVLLTEMITRFCDTKTISEESEGCSKYVSMVYNKGAQRNTLLNRLIDANDALSKGNWHEYQDSLDKFSEVLQLFRSSSSFTVDSMVQDLLTTSGKMYVVNLAPRANKSLRNDNVQAKLIEVILSKVIEFVEVLASKGEKANCMIVMDEAHRYVNASTSDIRLKELNKKIVDSVRTVRKYGIGHMFITQTIDSIDNEVIQQMRVFAFGYGLTMGSEFTKIKQIINDDNSAKFYKSFIDPSSNKKYPFMFHGPISPLSFTGTPLFVEMN